MAELDPDIATALERSSQLYTLEQVDHALEMLAAQIAKDLADKHPIVLPIMNGGLATAAALLRHFTFPLQQDYLHITRYRDTTSGGETQWIYRPRLEISGRHVLLVDDLLDHGITLQAAVDYCSDQDASSVKTAVLIVKDLRSRPGLQTVDYHALDAPDEYLFGCGMDYKTYWRNAPGIFAI